MRQLQARSVALGEAASSEIGGMATARGRRSRLRMREEENESEEEEMKAKKRERFRGVRERGEKREERGEREELIKKRKTKISHICLGPLMNKKIIKFLQFMNSTLPNLRLHCSSMPNILAFKTDKPQTE